MIVQLHRLIVYTALVMALCTGHPPGGGRCTAPPTAPPLAHVVALLPCHQQPHRAQQPARPARQHHLRLPLRHRHRGHLGLAQQTENISINIISTVYCRPERCKRNSLILSLLTFSIYDLFEKLSQLTIHPQKKELWFGFNNRQNSNR